MHIYKLLISIFPDIRLQMYYLINLKLFIYKILSFGSLLRNSNIVIGVDYDYDLMRVCKSREIHTSEKSRNIFAKL